MKKRQDGSFAFQNHLDSIDIGQIDHQQLVHRALRLREQYIRQQAFDAFMKMKILAKPSLLETIPRKG